jgi:P4 family phage/plasmid primase-like protien
METTKQINLNEVKQAPTENPYIIVTDDGKILDIKKLIEDLFKEFHFKTYDDTEEVLFYKNGYYMSGGETIIKSECQRLVGIDMLTEHVIKEIIGHIRRSSYIKRELFNQDKININLENGILNTVTLEFKSHSPDFLSTVRLPLTFNPLARAKRAMQFMKEVHHPEDIPVIQELFGNCLVPDNSIQKAFLFLGDGENGKSIEINLLRRFTGKANCSSVSLQKLEKSRFASSSLEGKLVNTFADLPSENLAQTTQFKMLTGDDAIDAEKKFKDGFSFQNHAKLIFSANKAPKAGKDDSHAFWRRWILIDFPNQFSDEKGNKDPDVLGKMTTEEELSGLLNWALPGLARLRQQKKYSYTKTVEETTEFYQKSADPVYSFLKEKCVPNSDPSYYELKDEAYKAYADYCQNNNLPTLKPNSFGRSLLNQAGTEFSIKDFRPEITEDGKKKRLQAYQGFRILE